MIADEVYKYTVYSGEPHIHFASLPDMFSRTVTLSSAGKTFSITGWQASSCVTISSNPIDSNEPIFMISAAPWQVGWCVGPAQLIKPIQLLLPFVQFCAPTPMQQVKPDVAVLVSLSCD